MSIGQFLERPRLLNRISSTKRKLKQQSSEMSPSNAQPQPPSYGMIDNDLITQANDLTSERVEFLSPPSGDIHVRGTSQPSEVHEDQFNSLGYAVNWDFVAVSSDFQHDLLFFNSRFAWYQYRYAKLIRETSHPEYSRALELQQRGIGIPLLGTHKKKLLSKKFLTIYKYTPPPKSENRLFDKENDKFQFCQVKRSTLVSCDKYELNFTPNPDDSSKDFTIVMFDHARHSIIDASEFNNVKYRWIKSYRTMYDYEYTLCALDSDQVSIADGVGKDTKWEPKSDNPLMKKRVRGSDSKVDLDGEEVGHFSNDVSKSVLPKFSQGIQAVFQIKDYVAPDSPNTQSVNAVHDNMLVLLCMSGVFDRVEVEKRRSRSSNSMIGAIGNLMAVT